MKIQQAYTDWAATYDSDRNLTRDLDEQVTRAILGQRRFDSILEIGCGTGKNTALFASIANKVQAIDFSAAMIQQARQRATYANVNFIVADLTTAWQVSEGSIDLISCNLVLEHVRDLGFMFAEAARILSAGGEFLVSELHPFRQYQGVQAHFECNGSTIVIPAFVHHVSDFLTAARDARLSLQRLNEWWHAEDDGQPIGTRASGVLKPVDSSTSEACVPNPPRLISFLFRKSE